MKAADIEKGDRFDDSSGGSYTVLHARQTKQGQLDVIELHVQYVDGGDGMRYFVPNDDVPNIVKPS